MTNEPRPARRTSLPACLVLIASILALLACGALPIGTSPTTAPATATAVPPAPTATASPSAVPPSPTPSPTRVERATTAAPSATKAVTTAGTPAPVVPAPAFDAVRAAVLTEMNANGGSIDGLAAVLERSGMAPEGMAAAGASSDKSGAIAADLDGDGMDEAVVVVEDQQSTSVVGSGAVFVVDRPAGEYAITYDSTVQLGETGAISLLAVEDANADSVADLAFTSQQCGASTCMSTVSVVSYRSGAYVDLSPSVTVTDPDLVALRDESGDGQLEIVLHGGTYGSVGAGPQRAATYVYSLSGDTYALADVRYDASDLIYFAIVDANAALTAGQTDDAVTLYQQAAGDEALRASGAMLNGMTEVEETEALRSFARFRLVVARALAGDRAAAEAAATEATAAGGPYAPLTEAFWAAYQQAGQVDAGCAAVAQMVEQDQSYLDILNSFGYANPTFATADVCQGTGTME